MSHTFEQRMNSDPKQKRERFQQLTQNPKVKTGKVFAADLRKSKIHPTVKKLTAWRKLNRLSQRKAVAVLAQYYFHATFPSLRSWEEGRRSPKFTYCRHSCRMKEKVEHLDLTLGASVQAKNRPLL
jgi:DNA-binding transcriptional regulator YiaG